MKPKALIPRSSKLTGLAPVWIILIVLGIIVVLAALGTIIYLLWSLREGGTTKTASQGPALSATQPAGTANTAATTGTAGSTKSTTQSTSATAGTTGAVQTGSATIDQAEANQTQEAVDNGEMQWRLDPLLVVSSEAEKYGFAQSDQFELVSKEIVEEVGAWYAQVRVTHNSKKYLVGLIQPATAGEHGIWYVDDIREE